MRINVIAAVDEHPSLYPPHLIQQKCARRRWQLPHSGVMVADPRLVVEEHPAMAGVKRAPKMEKHVDETLSKWVSTHKHIMLTSDKLITWQ